MRTSRLIQTVEAHTEGLPVRVVTGGVGGTSALMAVRHARGQLGLNTDFVNECFIGTTFTGRLVEETSVGANVAVVPTITGRAWLTATSQFMLDPSDPFPAGFTL